MQKIRQRLQEEKSKIGLVGSTISLQEYDEMENNLSAGISTQGWNIDIKLKKGFDPLTERRQKAYARKKKIKDGLETVLLDILTHECAHWELPSGSGFGCPYDTYNQDKIVEAAKSELPKGKQGMSGYVANAFADMLINARAKEFRGDFSGQVLFWDNEGKNYAQKQKSKGEENPHFEKFYEAFVKLNLHLWGDNADKALVKRHYSNAKEVDSAVESVAKGLRLPERMQDTSVLFKKKEWPNMIKLFTKYLHPLLDEMPEERLSAFSGQGGSQSEPSEEGEGQPKPNNGIEQKVGTREGKEDVAYGRYSSKEKQSSNLTSYEQLDALYRRLARDIPVKVEHMTKERSLEISPLNFRKFNQEKDDPAKAKLSKLFVDEEGINFGYKRQPITVTEKSKIQRRSFPDFKLVIMDNSGSMKQSPSNSDNVGNTNFIPWGDNSKYHYALLGFYGIENYLQKQGIAQYISHGISMFSSTTRYKEGSFSDIDKIRKQALNPEFGNTHLDASVLVRALRGKESFVLSVSDGEIGNWDSEKNTFLNAVKGKSYCHIQIGGKTEFSKDLEGKGFPVHYVRSGKDLTGLMVDLTRDSYRRLLHE